MSGNFGRRLYANIWEAANPFFARATRTNRIQVSFDVISPGSFARGLPSKPSSRKISSYSPRKTTQITRRFASGGFLVIGASPNSTAVENGTACAISSEKIISYRMHAFDKGLFRVGPGSLQRSFHTNNDSRPKPEISKDPINYDNQDSSNPIYKFAEHEADHKDIKQKPVVREQQPSKGSNRHLIDRLPHIPQLHRPTKEELLAAATGFWSRMKVRFKWFSIRSVRPFNLDEITALFSWVLLGHVVWVVLGTTTFFSLLIIAINTVLAQGMFRASFLYCMIANFYRNFGSVGR